MWVRASAAIRCGVAVFMLGCGTPALAGWGADPVTIRSTTESIPLVEGCPDGAHGTFVVWQEASYGMLRAHHLLPTGDLDPQWPADGALVCGVAAERAELIALPDRAGGAYFLWQETDTLFATRIDPRGAVTGGWPARGMGLDDVASIPYMWRPRLIEDGANGFYVAWETSWRTAAAHVGPAGMGTFGWPDPIRHDLPRRSQLALAPDGGAFVLVAGAMLRRLTPDGFTFKGWPADGIRLGTRGGSELALCPDGRGGVFALVGSTAEYMSIETRLYRRQSDGRTAVDWPEMGASVAFAPTTYSDYGPDVWHRMVPDEDGGVLLGMGANELTGDVARFVLVRYSTDGSWRLMGSVRPPYGGEVVSSGGGFFAASFHPNGQRPLWDQDAFIAMQRCCDTGRFEFLETHREPGISWYGDIGLAPTEDGGAVLFWSQVRDRVGLFARRFSATGEITWAKRRPRPAPRLGDVRFVAGEGLRAAITAPESCLARFELFDLAGRRLATQAIGPGAREVTIAGTASLPSGLYFGRLVAGVSVSNAKVVVAR